MTSQETAYYELAKHRMQTELEDLFDDCQLGFGVSGDEPAPALGAPG